MDTKGKLELLSDASRFDLACACGTREGEHRQRTNEGHWLYPVSLPRGGTSVMLKTLLSNDCVNDCRYCPLRNTQDIPRCSMKPDALARIFMDYVRQKNIFGLFLSSGVIRNPDYTMDRMIAVAQILRRRYRYRGYLHLKAIPGASDGALEQMISLASAISLNVEVPKGSSFSKLSSKKDYDRDIVRSIKYIAKLTRSGSRFARVKQTTQFIVGASDETDHEIVAASFGLYRRLKLQRIYYSAYQRGLGDPALPGEQTAPLAGPADILTREHRLYQVDWLIRKYGFDADEIPFTPSGNLSLTLDPKEAWAQDHPEFFPLDINRADKFQLLRVPGLGPVAVNHILAFRKNGGKIRSLKNVLRPGKLLHKAAPFLKYGY